MSVSETSADAFHSLSPKQYLQPKQRQIMALFTGADTRLSRQQIARKGRMSINCCCGRVDSLIAAGLLEEHGVRRDPLTQKRQKLLRLPQPDQGDLFKSEMKATA